MIKRKDSVFRTKADLIFYIAVLILPLLQFSIFYIYVNVNNVMLAFQRFIDGKYIFAGLENFKLVFDRLANDGILLPALKNSLFYYIFSFFLCSSLTLLFAFYIFKKRFLAETFKMFLFMPTIISSLVLIIMYKYFIDEAIPEVLTQIFGKTSIQGGLYSDLKTQYTSIIFYNLVLSFGPSLLVYFGSMKNISDSMIEAAQLDGVTPIKEFLFVVFPSVYSVFVTFTIGGVAGIFTNQLHMYSFRGDAAPNDQYNLGYYLYVNVLKKDSMSYPFLAAMSLVFSAVAIPVTFIMHKLLDKIGPSVD